MMHQLDRRRVEMSALRNLFAIGRLLAFRAQLSDDIKLKELGQLFDNELDCMRDAAIRNTLASERQAVQNMSGSTQGAILIESYLLKDPKHHENGTEN